MSEFRPPKFDPELLARIRAGWARVRRLARLKRFGVQRKLGFLGMAFEGKGGIVGVRC
jgi:hypothetical protein